MRTPRIQNIGCHGQSGVVATRLWRLLALVCLRSVVGLDSDETNASNPYLEAADFEVLQDAIAAEEKFCAGVDPMTRAERDDSRKELLSGIGGSNLVKSILVESNSSSEMATNAQTRLLNADWILANTAPLVMSFVMAILWYCFCWTACPFCRCCRICRRRKRCPWKVRLIVPIAMLGFMIGILTCIGLAAEGHTTTSDGVRSASCTSSRLLRTTLSGRQGDKAFIGMLGIMETFWSLDQKLEDDSDFLTALNGFCWAWRGAAPRGVHCSCDAGGLVEAGCGRDHLSYPKVAEPLRAT